MRAPATRATRRTSTCGFTTPPISNCSSAALTAERIKREFPHLVRGKVERYVIAHLHGLNFVMHDALEGGVNASLNLDSHGKSWSYLLLGLPLDAG